MASSSWAQPSEMVLIPSREENSSPEMSSSRSSSPDPSQDTTSSNSSFEFLDEAPISVPKPFLLNVKQVENLLDAAHETRYLPLQSIHIAKALRHRVFTLITTTGDSEIDMKRRMQECLVLQELGNQIDDLFDVMDSDTGDITISKLRSWQSRVDEYYESLCSGWTGWAEIRRSHGTLRYLEDIDWRTHDPMENKSSDKKIKRDLRRLQVLETRPSSDLHEPWSNNDDVDVSTPSVFAEKYSEEQLAQMNETEQIHTKKMPSGSVYAPSVSSVSTSTTVTSIFSAFSRRLGRRSKLGGLFKGGASHSSWSVSTTATDLTFIQTRTSLPVPEAKQPPASEPDLRPEPSTQVSQMKHTDTSIPNESISTASLVVDSALDIPIIALSEESLVPDLTSRVKRRGTHPNTQGLFFNCWFGILDRQQFVVMKAPIHQEIDQEETLKRLKQEVHTWWCLRHENLAPLLGLAQDPSFGKFGGMVLPLRGVISGIHYLHTAELQSDALAKVHGDLRPSNIFIDDNETAKLSGFGFLNITREKDSIGEPHYLAYEVVKNGSLPTCASDIHALACVSHEFIYLTPPYAFDGKDSDYKVRRAIENQEPPATRPKETSGVVSEVWNLLERAWSPQPENRPSSDSFRQFLAQRGIMLAQALEPNNPFREYEKNEAPDKSKDDEDDYLGL